ncbi:MAG: YlxM family DNA-binding protein [Clostridia bacterium]|nr:YlxM family DNA-binding protein [Clostridia bacterium]
MGKNLEISLLLDFYGEMLTEKQRDMVDYYYNDDLSLSEIAENEGITRQGVRDSIKRAEAQMLEMEERLGLARRFRKINADIEEIYELAQTIRRYSEFPGCPREVSESAARIMMLASMLEKAE